MYNNMALQYLIGLIFLWWCRFQSKIVGNSPVTGFYSVMSGMHPNNPYSNCMKQLYFLLQKQSSVMYIDVYVMYHFSEEHGYLPIPYNGVLISMHQFTEYLKNDGRKYE